MNQMSSTSLAGPISPSALASLVDDMKQWTIGAGNSGLVLPKKKFGERPERNYNLKGMTIGKFLQHEEQRFGINLGWTDDASPQTAAKVARWFFTRESGDDSGVRYGETIAVANGGDPSFIRYAERTVGINLDWSKTPVCEWKVLGGTLGTPVQAGQRVALFNEKANECLIYFDRTAGGDIGWPTSQRWEDKLASLAVKVGKEVAKKAVLAALGL